MRNFIFCILFLGIQSISYAQNQLGYIYYEEDGIAQDKSEAVTWFRKATEQGNGSVIWNLGGLYANGAGVQQNMNESIKWYRLVAGQGDADMEFDLPSDNNDTMIVDDNTIYDNVEQMPEFSGGILALMEFLNKNTRYPKEAKENGIQGCVIVSFVIENMVRLQTLKWKGQIHPQQGSCSCSEFNAEMDSWQA